MTQEALKMALYYLEQSDNYLGSLDHSKPIAAIKEALAQPEPAATVESVATVVSESGNQEVTMSWWHEPALPVGTKLYTTPPQRTWVDLTDEEIWDTPDYEETRKMYRFAKAIEAKLKEKNT